MFYMYILQSKITKEFYIGFALDLTQRLLKHNIGLVQSTKHAKPWEVIYYEAYRSKKDALIREKQLKRFAKGFPMLKRRLQNSLML